MLVCTVGYGGKKNDDHYIIEQEYLVPPSIAESFDIKTGTKVVISYKRDKYTVGNVLNVQEKNMLLKDMVREPYIIDVVDFSTSNNLEKIKWEYKLFQDIANAVKRYKDYSDYNCEMNIESHCGLDSCEQSVTLNFGSPLDPSGIFYDTFYKKDLDFDDEE